MEYVKEIKTDIHRFNEIEVNVVDAFTITKLELEKKEKEDKRQQRENKINERIENITKKINKNVFIQKIKNNKIWLRTKKYGNIKYFLLIFMILILVNVIIIYNFFNILQKM